MNKLGLVFVTGLVVACGCGSAPEPASNTTVEVSSTSFQSGQAIAEKYSSYGANISPGLSWKGQPAATKSFVLLCEDPDAPTPQPFVHWLVYNIPAATTEVQEGKQPEGVGGQNGTGATTYFGPKPPSGTHHYHFKVFAIDQQLSLPAGANKDDVMKAIAGHTLGQGEVVGLYSH